MELRSQFIISMISISVLLVFAGAVISSSLASQNSWDPRVYDPLGCGIQGKSTTVNSDFYNVSFSISANDRTTINKILLTYGGFFPRSSILNTTNLMVYMNGSALLKPFNMHRGDTIQADFLIPVEDVQANSTYVIETDTNSAYYGSVWNTNFFFNIPS